MGHPTECSPERQFQLTPRRSLTDVHVEPVPRLEWSLATEAHPHPTSHDASAPASLRRSWIHTAPQHRVLDLYRRLDGPDGRLPAPWWLRALARGEFESRAAAFAFEDEVHRLLTDRGGWVFVPWAGVGESGYWEYAPSERDARRAPTTVSLTDQHAGWLHVVPAYTDASPAPRPVAGVQGLQAMLGEVESW